MEYEMDAPTLSTFTCFPSLPKELQLKIWRLAALLPRDLTVFVHLLGWEMRDFFPGIWYTSHQLPAVLHICSDSRQIGLEYFDSHGFDTKYVTREGVKIDIRCRIYVNWISDRIIFVNIPEEMGVLCYGSSLLFHGIRDVLENVRSLAWDTRLGFPDFSGLRLDELILYRTPRRFDWTSSPQRNWVAEGTVTFDAYVQPLQEIVDRESYDLLQATWPILEASFADEKAASRTVVLQTGIRLLQGIPAAVPAEKKPYQPPTIRLMDLIISIGGNIMNLTQMGK